MLIKGTRHAIDGLAIMRQKFSPAHGLVLKRTPVGETGYKGVAAPTGSALLGMDSPIGSL